MMSEDDFDLKLKHIEEQYGTRRVGADAYRDQELARLFDKCGWGQERIARKMGKSQQWVDKRVRLAKFLGWLTTSGSKSQFPTETLTERRFRTCWAKTDKKAKESARFEQVLALLKEPPAVPPGYRNLIKKPGIKNAVIEALKSGERMSVPQIAAALAEEFPAITTKQVSQAMQDIQGTPPRGFAIQATHVGTKHSYRMVQRAAAASRPIDPDEAGLIVAEVMPLIEESRHELKKTPAAMSLGLLMANIAKIEQALSRLLVPAKVA